MAESDPPDSLRRDAAQITSQLRAVRSEIPPSMPDSVHEQLRDIQAKLDAMSDNWDEVSQSLERPRADSWRPRVAGYLIDRLPRRWRTVASVIVLVITNTWWLIAWYTDR